MTCAFVTRKCFALLFYERLGAYQDSRDTKAALQGSVGSKAIAITLELCVVKPFEGGDILAVGSFQGGLYGYGLLYPFLS